MLIILHWTSQITALDTSPIQGDTLRTWSLWSAPLSVYCKWVRRLICQVYNIKRGREFVCLFVCAREFPFWLTCTKPARSAGLPSVLALANTWVCWQGRAVAHAKGVGRRRSDCPRQRAITSKCLRGWAAARPPRADRPATHAPLSNMRST